MQYAFNSSRFALRGWPGHGGVVYDDADSALYEVSESAFQLLTLLKEQAAPTEHQGPSATQLAVALMGEPADDADVALVTSVLDGLRAMGVVTCRST